MFVIVFFRYIFGSRLHCYHWGAPGPWPGFKVWGKIYV